MKQQKYSFNTVIQKLIQLAQMWLQFFKKFIRTFLVTCQNFIRLFQVIENIVC